MAATLSAMMESTLGLEQVPPGRQIYSNRTLNLRTIRAIGYDMDYTLVHYRADVWEQQVYDRLKELFVADGWPIEDLEFDPSLVIRGLVIDTDLGNIVKANRFGYVMRAAHGTRPMTFEDQRDVYRHTPVDLSEPRFVFLNTLFSLSASCLYSQLVDLYDQHVLTEVHGYQDLFRQVIERLDETHIEGSLKADIMADPEPYIVLDPQAPLALLDQLQAGKRLMLISNSEWTYAQTIMSYAYDRFLPPDRTWRDLFELVIVGARKPGFFSYTCQSFRSPMKRRVCCSRWPARSRDPAPTSAAMQPRSRSTWDFPGPPFCTSATTSSPTSNVQIEPPLAHRTDPARARGRVGRGRRVSGHRKATRPMMAEKVEAGDHPQPNPAGIAAAHGATASNRTPLSTNSRPRSAASVRDPVARRAHLAAGREAAELENPSWGALLRPGNDKSHLARRSKVQLTSIPRGSRTSCSPLPSPTFEAVAGPCRTIP